LQQPSPELQDELLALQVQSGDVALWQDLAERALSVITPIVWRRVPDHDREDVTQDALIRFYNALPSFDPERAGLRTFITVLTNRQVADYYRRARRAPDTMDIDDLLDIIEDAAEYPTPGPHLLDDLAAHAGPDRWEIVQMRLDGYSWKEVADEIGCTSDAAKMRMKRTLEDMRKYLEQSDAGS
jgi:RNA polymerase sigma-70 factor (ECF subfamily)